MERSVFEMHWQYYLSIEKMLVNTNQYVTHTDKNKYVYSDEFSSILLLSCSELDSLFKQLCINRDIQNKRKYFNMEDYAQAIKISIDTDLGLATGTRVINDNNIIIFPFEHIDAAKPYANLKWWRDYQSIKHDRIKNVEKGNLLNVVNAVAAQFLILRSLIDFIDEANGKEYLMKHHLSDYWIPCV